MWKPCEEQAIRFLRGEENPFDALVVPDQPGQEFPQCHVAEVHAEESDRICRVIEKYRHPDYRARRQLQETRVLVVRGVRGSGKTHLMRVLAHRDTPTPEVWICPRYYDPAFPFAEYLLSELVRTLLGSEDAEAPARLRWCACELGRRLLCQAVALLGPHEWEEWARPQGTRRRGRWVDREALLARLWEADGTMCAGPGPGDPAASPGASPPLAEVCREHGLPPQAALALAMRHMATSEHGTGVAVRMRREVLLGFCELAFRGELDRLESFLEHDFAMAEGVLPPARAELVATLLQTLADILAAIHVPIIFAFDNMERLLAPKGPADLPAARSFFIGLAHVVDQTRGLLLVVFVETGLWNVLTAQAIDSFAGDRLRQGVRVRDYGCIWEVLLESPTPDQIEQVVRRRMAPLLARVPNGQQLPPCFPFVPDEVRNMATVGEVHAMGAAVADVLRTVLLRLRDRYDAIVLPSGQQAQPAPSDGRPEAGDTVPAAIPADSMASDWEQAVAGGRKTLHGSRRTALAAELHAGLARWLELLTRETVREWTLTEAGSTVYGDHPTFGMVTLGAWRAEDGRTCRVAIGPILGEGRAMPKDLEIKFSVFSQRPSLADQLVVLWPVQEGTVDAKQLPAATHQIWEQLAPRHAVSLCALPLADFAWLLAFPEWLTAHAAQSTGDGLRRFVLERTGYLLQEFAPRPPAEESP